MELKENRPSEETSGLSTRSRFGLRRRLVAYFILFGIVPVVGYGFLTHSIVKKYLLNNLKNTMSEVVLMKTQDVALYFLKMSVYAQNIANELSVYMGHGEVKGARKDTGGEISGSERVNIEKKLNQLESRVDSGEFSNVFLVNLSGKILYAVMDKNEVGESVFNGPLMNTPLSVACRKVIHSQSLAYSDYGTWTVSNRERVVGHLVTPLFNHDNLQMNALVVFQYDIESLNRIMSDHIDLGQTFEIYIVGLDGILRTDSGKRRDKRALKSVIDISWMGFPDPQDTEDVMGSRNQIGRAHV
jgi:hypothetical protein